MNIQGDDLIHFEPSGKKAERVSAWETLLGAFGRRMMEKVQTTGSVSARPCMSGPRWLPIMVFHVLFNYGRWANAALFNDGCGADDGRCSARQVAPASQFSFRLPT